MAFLKRTQALFAFLALTGSLAGRPPESQAAGGGTYLLGGIRTEFQFNQAHVQCKIAHAVMPDGTVIQMFMESKSINSVTIDNAANTVVISGNVLSTTRLRFTNGTSATLAETVPFVAFAQDNATPEAGADTFSMTVTYVSTPGLDQFDLFGSPATFAGVLETGDVAVR
jgi:hypothetical protein